MVASLNSIVSFDRNKERFLNTNIIGLKRLALIDGKYL